ncbi:hypothetical protein Ahy_A09g042224 isoform D [Arachis hypogaea]|uniref:RING-type domain-containing protein n=1 Tax=Arachis hypogaea TaxID=3818 RepID=A0A445BF60_ARAHY|nr:hypothetical protein Ahy_A09g042224 isoform D [Arachis hypogaea]
MLSFYSLCCLYIPFKFNATHSPNYELLIIYGLRLRSSNRIILKKDFRYHIIRFNWIVPVNAMVVCKCRKATKLYCFVHKVPVCGECICFPEHQICVVQTYSEWVIDGEYDWPPKCCQCQIVLEEGAGSQTTRLGCLHVIHTNCLVSHLKSFPPHTAPAGYVCPSCSTSIWPPKSVRDSGSRLHSKLKEAILQTGLEKNIFGNHPVSLSGSPPPAFASDPLINRESHGNSDSVEGYSATAGSQPSKLSVSDIVEIDGPNSAGNFMNVSSPVPGATTRKGSIHAERQNSEISYYADDEDGNRKKYTKRGDIVLCLKFQYFKFVFYYWKILPSDSTCLPLFLYASSALMCRDLSSSNFFIQMFMYENVGPFRHKFLRALLPFWSSALPTLPVTAPPRKDASNGTETSEGRTKHRRSSMMDPRKILLLIAIMACMTTMGILYYRLVQRGPGEEQLLPDEQI